MIEHRAKKHFVIGKETMSEVMVGYVTACGEKLISGGDDATDVDPVWILELENICESCSDYSIADRNIFEPIGVTQR